MEKLPDYVPASKPNRRAFTGRNGRWRKRYVVLIFLVFAWLVSRYMSQSIVHSHASLYAELQRMVSDATALTERTASGTRDEAAAASERTSSVMKMTSAFGNLTDTYQRALGM